MLDRSRLRRGADDGVCNACIAGQNDVIACLDNDREHVGWRVWSGPERVAPNSHPIRISDPNGRALTTRHANPAPRTVPLKGVALNQNVSVVARGFRRVGADVNAAAVNVKKVVVANDQIADARRFAPVELRADQNGAHMRVVKRAALNQGIGRFQQNVAGAQVLKAAVADDKFPGGFKRRNAVNAVMLLKAPLPVPVFAAGQVGRADRVQDFHSRRPA